MTELWESLTAALTPLDWAVAAAVAVSLYVLVDMWLTEPVPADVPPTGE